jgi:hypothetical protein
MTDSKDEKDEKKVDVTPPTPAAPKPGATETEELVVGPNTKDSENKPDSKPDSGPPTPKPEKKDDDDKKKSKDPNQQTLDMMAKLNQEINEKVTSACKKLGEAGIKAFMKTETGKALGDLKDAIKDKATELEGRAGESFKASGVGKALDKVSNAWDGLKNGISSGADSAVASGISKLAQAISNIGKEPLDLSQSKTNSVDEKPEKNTAVELKDMDAKTQPDRPKPDSTPDVTPDTPKVSFK